MGESFGRWLTGPGFEVVDLPSGDSGKAEEGIKLALCKRPLVVIDNVDSPAPWLEDFLCRYATGVRMSRRRLYTNTEEVHFTPRAGLIITSRQPHFRREDVARRLLPIRFQPIPARHRRGETEIRRELDRRRGAIWADVLGELARMQDAWPARREKLQPTHSLADFSMFGELLAAIRPGYSPGTWRNLMLRLELVQGRFTTEEDPLVDLLREALLATGVMDERPVSKLWMELRVTANDLRVPWPYSSPGVRIPAYPDRRFRHILIARSDPSRSPIPAHRDHRFRGSRSPIPAVIARR